MKKINWEQTLVNQITDYLKRCGLEPTPFQKNQIKKMIANGIKQSNKLTPIKGEEE